jgi:uncharacterized protein YndB with AHSA1/START domain
VATATKELRSEGRIGDAALEKRTGKRWREWFAILDRAGANKLPHKEIARWMDDHYPEIGGWWCQTITVGYEQARGLRRKHEKPGGFEVSGSKTIAVPLAKLYAAWEDVRVRARWLPGEKLTVRKATKEKSMRITWSDGTSSVSVNFTPGGPGKSKVAVQHGKLPNARAATEKKAFWSERLGALKALLER